MWRWDIKACRRFGFMVFYFFLSLSVMAQTKKFPATITPIVGPPYSIFLNEYSTPGTNLLSASIVFNDFNEPSWNFRLRIKIESSQVRIETILGYKPLSPITLAPGILQSFSGADWEEYLNYNNLIVAGASIEQLAASGGRLPEGYYSFCFQVLDYDSGDPLSEEICRTAWLKLVDPPRLNLPLCGNSLDPKLTQQAFSWQLFDTTSPNAQEGTEFQFTVWEITERGGNIQTSVANGQALQIFQSPLLREPTYLYGLSDPPLEIGKQYIYRVQAIDPLGRDKFKNQGYSEFCTFYYGWPIGGKVSLQFPPPGGGFRKKDIPYVKWSAVNTQLPGQRVSYEIQVAPIIEGQTEEQALQSNEPWYYYNTPPTSSTYDRSQQIDKSLEVMTKYAWQVKAFTDQQEIGKSEVSHFNGPSLMENFWAGVHRVAVDYLDGTNLDDISGGGRIRLAPDANAWTTIKFDHIKLQNMGDFYLMVGGEFYHEPSNKSVELRAEVDDNGRAYFDIARFRVNKEGIYAEGSIRWSLPFATLTSGTSTVKSEKIWASYNNFAINTAVRIAEGNRFKLLEPFNFSLNLATSGLIYVDENRFRFDLNGDVEIPEKVKGPVPGLVKFPFKSAEQLFYIAQDSSSGMSTMAPLAKANFELQPRKYILDLSEEKSPDKFQSNPLWKGIYLENFDIKVHTAFDGNGQFSLLKEFTANYAQTTSNEVDAWILSTGLNLKWNYHFPDSIQMSFQSFPSMVRHFQFEMKENQVVGESSLLKGTFLLPFISTTKEFAFTVPINNVGFQDGFLDDLTGTRFTFNEGGGDQEIRMVVKRSVLSGYEKIAMTLDVEWQSLGITLAGLADFHAWGDYSIGFGNRNGTVPLTQRYNASLSGYPITVGVIGAGSNDGHYIFATTADAVLGDDVSGGEGVPSINVYSVVANKFVVRGASGEIVANPTQSISFDQASSSITQNFQQLQKDLVSKLEVDQEKIVQEVEGLKAALTSEGGNLFTPEDIVGTSEKGPSQAADDIQPPTGGRFTSRQQEIIYEIAAGFVEEMAKPILAPLKNKTDSLSLAISSSVNKVVDKVSEKVKTKVDVIVKLLADKLVKALGDGKINVEGPIREMQKETVRIIVQEITGSLRLTAKNNITDPVNVLLKDKVYGRVNKHITQGGTKIVYASITGDGGDSKEALKALIDGTPAVVKAIFKDVENFVSIDHIRSTIESTADDFVKNINVSEVGHDLRVAGEKILKEAINKEAAKALGGLAEKYAPGLNLSSMGGEGKNPINFVGVAGRLAKGDIKGAFAIDPVRVRLRTPVIELDGFMKYTPKHPVYGDVWVGDIDMTFKVPKRFSFNAIYFNGRKDEISYWFCQITPPEDSNKPYELGKPLSKRAKPLKDPVDIGMAKIVGASGRLYHHMKEAPGNGIVPDASMKYGAFMHFVFFDKKDNGANLRLEVSGEINSSENGDYTIAFDGNLQVRSKKPEIFNINKGTDVQGTVIIRYNSAEEHFFGYAKVILRTKENALCAEASLLVDVKPGKWRIAIGSREERIIFVPGCAGWSPTGWLDINQNEAELGLGVQYAGQPDTPTIPIGPYLAKVKVDAGFAFGILAVVQYSPNFALQKAGVWADLWANVNLDYKLLISKNWKSVSLVEIFIRGDMVIIFNPPPTVLEGKLNGHVKVLFFDISFQANMRKEL